MVSATYVDAVATLPNIEITGAMGRSEASGRAFLERYKTRLGAARAYGDVSEIIEDPRVDFVCLTTPPNARADLVRALAAAGKPILMEKPVERTLAAAEELCEICEGAGVPLGIMLQHRARPSALALAGRVGPDFGPLRMVEITVPWWRDQAYYDEPGRGTYARDGGGVMISQAIHTLDLALQFTGPVRSVVALSETTGFHRMEAEDFVTAGLRFEKGALGSVIATTASFPGRAEEIILHYAKVSARLQAGLLELNWQSGESETIGASGATGATGAGVDPMAFTSDWHGAMIADFAAAIRDGRDPIAPGRSALPVHGLMEAIAASARDGRRVEVGS